uniref:Secreted protein n=1 Tax=Leptobrachium leishanense TaxID=445787 RepID=A0A8C5QP20_9ANUR
MITVLIELWFWVTFLRSLRRTPGALSTSERLPSPFIFHFLCTSFIVSFPRNFHFYSTCLVLETQIPTQDLRSLHKQRVVLESSLCPGNSRIPLVGDGR